MSNTSTVHRVTRKGAGRTKGSFSFVAMPLSELNTKLGALPSFKLLVSRKQLETLGFTNLVTDRISDLKESIEGQATEPITEVKATEL